MGNRITPGGPRVTQLRVIEDARGSVRHGLRASDTDFVGFGEGYFSEINSGAIKGWKQHTEMTLNLVVVSGCIRFIVLPALNNPQEGLQVAPLIDIELSPKNHQRLMVPPLYWVAFMGLDSRQNTLVNFASHEYSASEANNLPISHFEVTGAPF